VLKEKEREKERKNFRKKIAWCGKNSILLLCFYRIHQNICLDALDFMPGPCSKKKTEH